MKRITIVLFFLINVFCYADLPMDSFLVKIQGETISLGDDFSKVISLLGNEEYELLKMSYITLRQYDYDDITVYTSNPSGKGGGMMIYGVSFVADKFSIIDEISIGNSKSDLLGKLGEPDKIRNNFFYYYNKEYDVLEAKIGFNSEDTIDFIRIFMGT